MEIRHASPAQRIFDSTYRYHAMTRLPLSYVPPMRSWECACIVREFLELKGVSKDGEPNNIHDFHARTLHGIEGHVILVHHHAIPSQQARGPIPPDHSNQQIVV